MSTHDEGWESRANRLEVEVARLEGRLREHHDQVRYFYKVCPVCQEKLREEKSSDQGSARGRTAIA